MYCPKCGYYLRLLKRNYCPSCGHRIVTELIKEVKEYDQEVYAAAHRMYRDWQSSRKKTEEAKLRDIAREVCREMLLVEYEKRNRSKLTLNRIPTRAGLQWTPTEDTLLEDELCEFVENTAKSHQRTYGSIASRLRKFYSRVII